MSGTAVRDPTSQEPLGSADAPLARVQGRHRRRGSVVTVALLGIILTGIFGYRTGHKSGVYSAQVNVLLLPAAGSAAPNALADPPSDLISMAGLVARIVDPRAPSARAVSPDVTLANQGIRHGDSVTLPNYGGQWADNFTKPLLDVQAVGSSSTTVSQDVERLLAKINQTVTSLQDDAHVASRYRISTQLNPSNVQIYYDAGRRTRALAVTLALGLVLTVVATAIVGRHLRRIRA
jgi:hypothetical protein